MITELNLENFKSWKSAHLSLGKLTGLFGTNSSGKTSLIQSLLLLKQTVESSDRAQVLNFGDVNSYVELGTFSDIVFEHEIERKIQFGLRWNLSKQLTIKNVAQPKTSLFQNDELEFSVSIEQEENGKIQVRQFAYNFDKSIFKFHRSDSLDTNHYILNYTRGKESTTKNFRFLRAKGRKWNLPKPIKFYGYPNQVVTYFQNAQFLSSFQLEFEKLFGKIYYLGPLRDYPKRQYTWAGGNPSDMGRRGEQVIDAVLASGKRNVKIGRGTGRSKFTVEEYVAYWLKKLKLIHSFSIKEIAGGLFRVFVRKHEHSPEVLISEVGFGVSQILPVITLCYYAPKGSILLMEQPEIHLHPSVQAGLADVFIDAIKVRGVQIIVESHSEYFIKRLQRRIAEETFSADDTQLYFCTTDNTGTSQLNALRVDTFGNITNWPQDFFGDELGDVAQTAKAIIARKRQLQRNGVSD